MYYLYSENQTRTSLIRFVFITGLNDKNAAALSDLERGKSLTYFSCHLHVILPPKI